MAWKNTPPPEGIKGDRERLSQVPSSFSSSIRNFGLPRPIFALVLENRNFIWNINKGGGQLGVLQCSHRHCHQYHVFEVINPSNISSSFSCYNPNGHCYHTRRYHPYYHLHPNPNPNPSGGVVGRQIVRVGLKWQKLCLSFPLFRLASLRFEGWYSTCQDQLWKRQTKMDLSN